MERRTFFARAAAASVALPVAGAVALAGASGLTDLDVQAQLDASGTVELPPGEIVVYRGLRVPSRTILRGAGQRTVLRAAPGLTVPVIRFTQPDGLAAEREIQGCGLENLTIAGTGSSRRSVSTTARIPPCRGRIRGRAGSAACASSGSGRASACRGPRADISRTAS